MKKETTLQQLIDGLATLELGDEFEITINIKKASLCSDLVVRMIPVDKLAEYRDLSLTEFLTGARFAEAGVDPTIHLVKLRLRLIPVLMETHGVTTVGSLCELFSREELLKFREIGDVTVTRLEEVLAYNGLKLKS